MNTTEEYSKFLVATNFEDLPAKETERFKSRFLDCIGVAAAGIQAPGIPGAIDLFKKIGGLMESSVLFTSDRLPADKASFINSMMMRSFDFEPCGSENPDYTTGPAHISGSTVPCTLAMSEMVHASGKQAICANVLGDDLAARLCQATGFNFHQGWDNTGTVTGFGSTAIAAKLLKLDEKTCRDAFGIDIHTLGGSFDGVKDGVLSFKVPHGLAGMNGIFSARLAQAGITGIEDAFTGRHGYFNLYGEGNHPEIVMQDLGKFYYSDGGVKPWPCCRITHSPIQSAIKLVKEHSINTRDIMKVVLHLHDQGDLVDRPFKPIAPVLMFNVRYVVAVALTQGAVLPIHHSDKYQLDPEIIRLATCTDVVYDRKQEHALSSDTELFMKDGTVYENHIYQPIGDFKADPMTREQLLDKFYSNMDYSGFVSKDRADKIVDAIDHFEDIEDVGDFIALLAGN